MADDLISRQAAIDLFPNDVLEWDTNFGYIAPHFARRMIEELPSAQSETEGLFEWCHDCKEYDRKAHCCHRWTKVIRKTVDEIKAEQSEPNWIPCSIKLPKKTGLYYVTIRDEKNDIEYTSCMNFYVSLARWEVDVNVIAWMPEPEPYRG